MARAIAAMELLGPNPEATVRYVQDRVAGDPELFEPGQLRKRDRAERSARSSSGCGTNIPARCGSPRNRGIALAFSTYRGLASAAKLGSRRSPRSATSATAWRRGVQRPADAGIVGDYLKLLNPPIPSDRLLAAYLSFVPEVWTSAVAGQSRFLAEELTGEFGRRVSDGVLRAAGLSAITDAGRQAHGLVTFIYATMVRDKAYRELEPAWRAALQRYRIGEKEWDAIRARDREAAQRARPADAGDDRRRRAQEPLPRDGAQRAGFRGPGAGPRDALAAQRQRRKGTWPASCCARAPLMFRTFTISSLLRHGGRMVEQSAPAASSAISRGRGAR
jgi:hypothetical protein